MTVAYCAIVTLFADSFDLPGWTQQASPFAHTPRVRLDQLALTPLLMIALLVAALVAAGLLAYERRDLRG